MAKAKYKSVKVKVKIKSKKPTNHRPEIPTEAIPVSKKIQVDMRTLHKEMIHKVRAQKKKLFLEAFAKYGTIGAGCQAASIRRERYHEWYAADPVFAKQCDNAKVTVGDLLEKEVIRRAVEGEEKIIRDKQGNEVDTVFEKSDTLLMFATKRHRPEYRDKFEVPLIPAGTTNIQNNLVLQIDPSKLPLDQLEAYERLLSSVPTPVHGSPAPAEAQGSPPRAVQP